MSENKVTTNDLDLLSGKFEEYYEKLSDPDVLQKVIKIMHTKEMRELVESFLKDSEDDEFELEDDSYLRLLKNIIKVCNSIYNYTGSDTGISDSEYDELIEFYKSISNDESIITEALIDDGDAHHKFKTLRGTLDKIYKITDEDVLKNKSQKSLEDWVSQTERRYEEATGQTIDLMEEEVIVMPKFDGVSVVFECDKDGNLQRALTRGDTSRNKAQDITHIFRDVFKGSLDNQKFPYGEKTEVMMIDDKLTEYNDLYHKDYKNTRSIVSSILNSKEKDERVDYLHIVPLRISYLDNNEESQQVLAPEVYNYPYLKCKLKEVDKIHEFAFNHKTVYPGLRCDGVVIQLTNPEVQIVLGRENEKQKFEVAFKFTEETAYSEVVDIEFTTGLFGRLNPVVVFKPVKMKGNKVERASLGSYSRFKELELCKGDVIKVLYDIIPYVIYDADDYKCSRSGKKVLKSPDICPDCGDVLEVSETGDILRCVNPKCPCRERGKILNFCKKMHIANISYATVEDFYREGFLTSIKDLYDLHNHVNEISQIDGYGAGKIKNILDEIDNHREVEPSVLLGALGIESISTKTFKNILNYISMNEIVDIAKEGNIEFFTVIPGIKTKTAEKLVVGINENRKLIEFLKNELVIMNETSSVGEFSVVFTKVRDDELEEFIKESGGIVADSLTKDTSILVVPVKETTSSKVSKAKKYGIPVIPINDLRNYITETYL